MKKIILAFFLLSFTVFMFAEKIVPMPDLEKPGGIIVDQGQVLITEFPSVYIYSLKDFKLIKKFGKAGQGPQEFAGGISVHRDPEHPDKIVVGSAMKVSYFTRTGGFIKEVTAKSKAGRAYKPLGKNYVAYGTDRDRKTRIYYKTINLHDANLEKIKEIHREKGSFQQGRKTNALRGAETWAMIYDNKIFVTGGKDGYIFVFDDNGDRLFSIECNTRKIKVTEKDKVRYHYYYKTYRTTQPYYDRLKNFLIFPDYFPKIRGMYMVDNKIYVNGYLREDGKTEFYIYDLKGNLLKEKIALFLPERDLVGLYPYTIKDGKVYQVVDNVEKEEWELHIHTIE